MNSLVVQTSAKMSATKLSRLAVLLTALTVAAPLRGVAGAVCECVPFYLCDANDKIITDGAAIFDVKTRLGEERVFDVKHGDCPLDDHGVGQKCCLIPPEAQGRIEKPVNEGPVNDKYVTEGPVNEDYSQEATSEERPYEPRRLCGTSGGSAVVGSVASQRIAHVDGDTAFGEFPWMLALSKTTEDPNLKTYKCGATLIHPRVALTAAHCVHEDLDPSHYVVRAGEHDASTTDEALPYQDRAVYEILVPAKFNKKSLIHDLALLHLESSFELADHIAPICLPDAVDQFDGEKCVATGWGRSDMDGPFSTELRKVNLLIVSRPACQTALRETRLGRYFILDPSFVCAQGKIGEDTCDGDGGSPLICPHREDATRWMQVGITAWGIGCGSGVPAAYANVARDRAWIDDQLQVWGYGINDDLDANIAKNIAEVFNTSTMYLGDADQNIVGSGSCGAINLPMGLVPFVVMLLTFG